MDTRKDANFQFQTGNKFGPKNQYCQSELKFGTYTNLNMQNSMVVFTFSMFNRKYLFWGKFGPRNQSCQLELKFGIQTNSNMHTSMMMLTFSVFEQKYPFWTNLFQKTKIFSLSWNLVPRLIRICTIQWWCSLFLFQTGNTIFGSKSQNCQFKLKFSTQTNSNMQNSMGTFCLSLFRSEILFFD